MSQYLGFRRKGRKRLPYPSAQERIEFLYQEAERTAGLWRIRPEDLRIPLPPARIKNIAP